ncbi:MAG TPA: M48 family metalloprotease, partial [Candidatus Wallbacteria bacterium]|nr:M48 family metalloprotease [Candidatus Wallbacteria bacterium]
IIVAPIVAMLLQMAISRSREYGADYFAAKLAGDADGLMSALIKLDHSNRMPHQQFSSPATATLCIVNPFSGSALFSIFSTHPSTESRIAELRKVRF